MKRALVLSGGGNKGAFEAGAVYQLMQNKRMSFDLFSGTSVGAVNAAYLAQGRNFEEQLGRVEALKQKWLSIRRNREIYRFNLLNIIKVIFGGPLYQPFGLKKWIESSVSSENLVEGKPLLVPTIALEDGQLYVADSRFERDRNEMTRFLLASASMPVYFPSVEIRKKHWVDGGLREITPLSVALKENPRQIVVITTYPVNDKLDPVYPGFTKGNDLFSIIHRVLDIVSSEIAGNDLKLIKKLNQERGSFSNKRKTRLVLISPIKPLNDNSLKFSPNLISNYFDLGVQAAKNPRIF